MDGKAALKLLPETMVALLSPVIDQTVSHLQTLPLLESCTAMFLVGGFASCDLLKCVHAEGCPLTCLCSGSGCRLRFPSSRTCSPLLLSSR